VYVLGALSPAQRVTFERHLATCDECRAEVNDLAVLPGLLGRLDEPAIATIADELPPPSILPGVLSKVRRLRRGRRAFALAAAVVLVAVALVTGFSMPQRADTPPVAVSVAPSPKIAWFPMTPVHPTSVTAKVALTDLSDGTRVSVKCQYGWAPGTTYAGTHTFALFAYPRDGEPAQQVTSWLAEPGQNIAADGQTAFIGSEIARLELRDYEGQPLLVYNMPPS
jgi:hypothetical protein